MPCLVLLLAVSQFSSLHLQEFPRASMQSFYAHMLHTPTRALVRVREEFVKVRGREALRGTTHPAAERWELASLVGG